MVDWKCKFCGWKWEFCLLRQNALTFTHSISHAWFQAYGTITVQCLDFSIFLFISLISVVLFTMFAAIAHNFEKMVGDYINMTCIFPIEWRCDWRKGKIFTDEKYVAESNYLLIKDLAVNNSGTCKCFHRSESIRLAMHHITVKGTFCYTEYLLIMCWW